MMPARSFALLCWNLLDDAYITDSWYPLCDPEDLRGPCRAARVVDRVGALEADVMAFQECSADTAATLRAAFPDHSLAWTRCGRSGLAVMVRGANPFVRDVPMPGSTKAAQLVRLPGGATLANVHLSWTGDPTPGQDRAGLDQLRRVLDHAPDLVAGDFNAFPHWPERQEARARGWVELGPEGPTCTVHQRLQPLDAVLGRAGWSSEAATLCALTPLTPMPSPVHPSDHLPVRVRLTPPD